MRETIRLEAPVRGVGHAFGASVAASDDRILVGCPATDFAARVADGEDIEPPYAAFFVRTAGQWDEHELLVPQDPNASEYFGRTVFLGDDFALVGAMGQDNGDGPVAHFDLAVDDDEPLSSLDIEAPRTVEDVGFDLETLGDFGAAVVGDERCVIVGWPLEDGENGVVLAYSSPLDRMPARVATQVANELGRSLSLSGDLLAVGAPATYTPDTPGSVTIFARDAAGKWRERQRIVDTKNDGAFGASVALDGSLLVVGAPGDPPVGGPRGRVHLFDLDGPTHAARAQLDGPTGFGASLALDGERLVIGSPLETVAGVEQAGRVALHRVSRSGVVLEDWIEAPTTVSHARLGTSVALGLDFVVAGAPGLARDDDDTGFVLVADF